MNNHALVYFTSFEEDGRRKWPKNPDEVIRHKCRLCVKGLGRLKLTNKCWTPENAQEASEAVYSAVQLSFQLQTNIIWGVHPKSIILPMCKWHLMRPFDADMGRLQEELNFMGERVFDLCEAFHKPAILTYEQRSSFGPDTLRDWLGIPYNEDESVVLEALWNKLP